MSSLVVSLFWLLLFVGGGIFLAYQRIDLRTSTIAAGIAVLAYTIFGEGAFLWKLVLWAMFGAMIVPNLIEFRREKITKPLLDIYRKMLPSMSDTEREALEAGNVWWDGELFSGMPDWDRLMSYPAPQLSEEEQAFLDGPCEELCRMLDEWEIAHERADMPKEVWDYIIETEVLRDDHSEAVWRPGIFVVCERLRHHEARKPQRYRLLDGRRTRTRSVPLSCCCTTAPRSRRIATCPVSLPARRSRVSH